MKRVAVGDGNSGAGLWLEPKGFMRGAMRGYDPIVALVLTSTEEQVVGHFEMTPEEAQVLGEYLRQEAEFAAAAQEEIK